MEEGSSSGIINPYSASSSSSTAIKPITTSTITNLSKIDRNKLGWMTSIGEEINIPSEYKEEYEIVKNFQRKSTTHRINPQRTNWLYFWSGGFDILLSRIEHVKLVGEYAEKLKLFEEKYANNKQKKDKEEESEKGVEKYDKEMMNEENRNNYSDIININNNDKMDTNEDNNNNNKNDLNNNNDDEIKIKKFEDKFEVEKRQAEEELENELNEIKLIEIQINNERRSFTGRIKFLNSIWDEDFFSPFETINSSAYRLNNCYQDCSIIRLSSTIVGNITIVKRSFNSVFHRRCSIVGDRIYDAEYSHLVHSHSASKNAAAKGYYSPHLLNYICEKCQKLFLAIHIQSLSII